MFTHPAFIRKNTPELRGKLKEFGYEIQDSANSKRPILIVNCIDSYYAVGLSEAQLNFINTANSYFDCGTNEPLFLAVAAINNETDENQWFTDGEEWVFCDRQDWVDMYSVLCCGGAVTQDQLDRFHKATIVELVERFK